MQDHPTPVDDVRTLEDGATDEAMTEALQRCINTGTAWRLPGPYSRMAMDAINAGDCVLGREAHEDFYGNIIPSRAQVLAGTKGSLEFVARHHNQAYADHMASL